MPSADIPQEVLDAKALIDVPLVAAGLITGMDIGVRDEANPDPNDLALRVFVADADAIAPEVQAAVAGFPFPVVFIARTFVADDDTSAHRPVVGGVSVGAARFVPTGAFPVGTLGGIARRPPQVLGVSNHHVLCVDPNRAPGTDEIIQPEPAPFGRVPDDHLGTLDSFAFPENVASGTADAACCTIDISVQTAIADIGACIGTAPAQFMLEVRKRGRTTGLTSGFVSGLDFTCAAGYPNMPSVAGAPPGSRIMTGQIHITPHAPLAVFSDSGDSGSVLVDDQGRAVALIFGSGIPPQATIAQRTAVATPIAEVEAALNVSFTWPIPILDALDPPATLAGGSVTISGSGFLLASDVSIGGVSTSFSADGDTTIVADCPAVEGDVEVAVTAPGGTSDPFVLSVSAA